MHRRRRTTRGEGRAAALGDVHEKREAAPADARALFGRAVCGDLPLFGELALVGDAALLVRRRRLPRPGEPPPRLVAAFVVAALVAVPRRVRVDHRRVQEAQELVRFLSLRPVAPRRLPPAARRRRLGAVPAFSGAARSVLARRRLRLRQRRVLRGSHFRLRPRVAGLLVLRRIRARAFGGRLPPARLRLLGRLAAAPRLQRRQPRLVRRHRRPRQAAGRRRQPLGLAAPAALRQRVLLAPAPGTQAAMGGVCREVAEAVAERQRFCGGECYHKAQPKGCRHLRDDGIS